MMQSCDVLYHFIYKDYYVMIFAVSVEFTIYFIFRLVNVMLFFVSDQQWLYS